MKRFSSLVGPSSIVVLLAALGACVPTASLQDAGGTGGGGAAGTGGMVACGGAPATSDKANWAGVREVVDLTCQGADCHAQGDREPILFGLTGPLSDADLYTKLTTFKSARCMGRMMVKPCAPTESAFYLAQAGLCEGGGGGDGPLPYMPFGCMPIYDNCTAAPLLEGIKQWIAKGAPRQ